MIKLTFGALLCLPSLILEKLSQETFIFIFTVYKCGILAQILILVKEVQIIQMILKRKMKRQMRRKKKKMKRRTRTKMQTKMQRRKVLMKNLRKVQKKNQKKRRLVMIIVMGGSVLALQLEVLEMEACKYQKNLEVTI